MAEKILAAFFPCLLMAGLTLLISIVLAAILDDPWQTWSIFGLWVVAVSVTGGGLCEKYQ